MKSDILKLTFFLDRNGKKVETEVDIEISKGGSGDGWGDFDGWENQFDSEIISAQTDEGKIRLTEEEKEDILAEAEDYYEKLKSSKTQIY